jgi:hypothetical protein
MNPGLTKTYLAEGTIAASTIVKAGSAEGAVAQATASTDVIVGVAERINADAGERVDVIHTGITDVLLGGTCAYGDWLTAGASGHAVKAAPAAGVNAQVAGKALAAGVAGDIIPMLITLTQIQG